ncbi:WUSCHEL-related homeobox 9 [Sesamum angolense]|uniref:WUSCHEL-related homeobox 9 n=1 Tax=Sesamum angolense TaxID=2727404 RepID=A0AAE1WTV2_9LAMI|nr:WUSCHEL-related homeobox 9 [Sesamum angolense]
MFKSKPCSTTHRQWQHDVNSPLISSGACHRTPYTSGLGEQGPAKLTVFINDVCFEVGVGPFNVREAFGDDAVLIQSSGQPVLTNEWGVTLQPLQHGAFYYLLRPFTPSPDDIRTIHLVYCTCHMIG